MLQLCVYCFYYNMLKRYAKEVYDIFSIILRKILNVDNLFGYSYRPVLVSHHIGNCQPLNGSDVPLHVIEVRSSVRLNRKNNFRGFNDILIK